MQKITTFLTFNHEAGEAAEFYTSVFKNARVLATQRYGDAGPGPKGSVMSAQFEIEGQPFIALNGGPHFTFSQGISLFINCEGQEEVDELWEKLSDGGEPGRCGWLKDKFGVSWQVIPSALGRLMGGGDAARSGRVMKAMMGMNKIDIAALQQAADGR